ncbi:hypothetical protein INH39_01400 [Massilia violaceinigra]|uniref:Uncharacterized protein n=1 Tax=Massilia violaceinigra TaxID=2045208 RepID=A0ABY4A6N0_9BURK|nr:hypothetical protein [Massilia violaceinigra]UOD30440.1 hypothetical protein INH39_01400 [Massilia violaceinigra]
MDQATETKVLNSLYDRLFQAVTYAPPGKDNSAFTEQTTFLQFAQNQALNPADFANMLTPSNPKGTLNAAQTFANMVDQMPSQTSSYSPSATLISETYKAIADGANSIAVINPEQQKKYDQAYAYLNVKTSITDYTGATVEQTDNSPIYKTYLANQTAYIKAVSAYRTAYLGYDLTDVAQQRQWQANAPLLSNNIDQTYATWQAQGAKQVEQALAALASAVNDAIGNAIAQAQKTMATGMESSTGDGSKWYFTYPIPSNFADPAAPGFSQLTFKSDYLEETASSKATDWGASGSAGWGLWSASASASGHHAETHSHMDASKFELSAEIAVVRIFRPWLNELIFKMNNWYVNSTAIGDISNGKLTSEKKILPLIPTGFVVARNIAITADWSSDDKKHVEDAIATKASVGWGPFSVAGGYSNSSSSDYHASTFDGGTLKIPGIQIIAWISEITPLSPPMNAP